MEVSQPFQLVPKLVCEIQRAGPHVTVLYADGTRDDFDLRKDKDFLRAKDCYFQLKTELT